LCPSVSSFSRFSLTIARWLTNVYDVDTTAGNPTTTRDVTIRDDDLDRVSDALDQARHSSNVANPLPRRP
jgi:hypothetical protein